ncbi:MAG TPA: hypothetical protein VGC72_17695 [Candidatus Elarobacter sp.]|jgi:hypothetical protein
MRITIDQISLSGFGNVVRGGSPPVANYVGFPLFCHVVPTAKAFAIIVNKAGPSTYAAGTGEVESVTLDYQEIEVQNGPAPLVFLAPGAVYSGRPIDLSLELTSPVAATLVLEQRTDAVAQREEADEGEGDAKALDVLIPTITTVKVSRSVTNQNDRIFFVTIPFPPGFDVSNVKTASIEWTDLQGGSSVGPIGGANIP